MDKLRIRAAEDVQPALRQVDRTVHLQSAGRHAAIPCRRFRNSDLQFPHAEMPSSGFHFDLPIQRDSVAGHGANVNWPAWSALDRNGKAGAFPSAVGVPVRAPFQIQGGTGRNRVPSPKGRLDVPWRLLGAHVPGLSLHRHVETCSRFLEIGISNRLHCAPPECHETQHGPCKDTQTEGRGGRPLVGLFRQWYHRFWRGFASDQRSIET